MRICQKLNRDAECFSGSLGENRNGLSDTLVPLGPILTRGEAVYCGRSRVKLPIFFSPGYSTKAPPSSATCISSFAPVVVTGVEPPARCSYRYHQNKASSFMLGLIDVQDLGSSLLSRSMGETARGSMQAPQSVTYLWSLHPRIDAICSFQV